MNSQENVDFGALMEVYGSDVYTLALRLTASSAEGWLLTRAAFLEARAQISTLLTQSPRIWFYERVTRIWYAPFAPPPLWRRLFYRRKTLRPRWLPNSTEAYKQILGDDQETFLQFLKMLDPHQRLVIVLKDLAKVPLKNISLWSGLSLHEIEQKGKEGHAYLEKIAQNKSVDRLLASVPSLPLPADIPLDVMKRSIAEQKTSYENLEYEHALTHAVKSFLGLLFFLMLCLFCIWYFYGYRISSRG